VTGPSFLEDRWLCWHLHQQRATLCSKVQSCCLLRQGVAQEIRNSWGTEVTAVDTLMYCVLQHIVQKFRIKGFFSYIHTYCLMHSQLNFLCKKFHNLQEIAHTRVGTLIVAAIYLQLIQNRYMFGLSPCDFHLIPKMKEPLRGIRFRTVPEILQAVDRSIRTINTTGAAKGILRLPHRWQRVVHNAGDYIEGQ